jgi:hypothetical protein
MHKRMNLRAASPALPQVALGVGGPGGAYGGISPIRYSLNTVSILRGYGLTKSSLTQKPEDASDTSAAPSPTAPIELIADTGPIELPGSEPGTNPDTSADFPIWAECNEVAKAIPDIDKYLGHLQFLQQRSMDDLDAKPNTSINNELYALSCKVAHSPASAGFKSMMVENGHNLMRSIEGFKKAEEDFAGKLRTQMVASYISAIPEASEADAHAMLEGAQDRMGFITVRHSLLVSL